MLGIDTSEVATFRTKLDTKADRHYRVKLFTAAEARQYRAALEALEGTASDLEKLCDLVVGVIAGVDGTDWPASFDIKHLDEYVTESTLWEIAYGVLNAQAIREEELKNSGGPSPTNGDGQQLTEANGLGSDGAHSVTGAARPNAVDV